MNKATIHMLGYLTDEQKADAKGQGLEDDTMHLLGYLDTPQWLDASNILKGEDKQDLLHLAKKVDEHYDTNFHGDMVNPE